MKCSGRGRAKRSPEKCSCSDFGSCFWLYWVECVHSTSKNEEMSNWTSTIWGQSAKHSVLHAELCLLKLLPKPNRASPWASAGALMTSVLWACRAVQGRSRGIKYWNFEQLLAGEFFCHITMWSPHYEKRLSMLWNLENLIKSALIICGCIVICHTWDQGIFWARSFSQVSRQCKIKKILVTNGSFISGQFRVLGAMCFGAMYFWFQEMLHFVGAKHRLIQRKKFTVSVNQVRSETQFGLKWVKLLFIVVVWKFSFLSFSWV